MADYRLRVDEIYQDFTLNDCKLLFSKSQDNILLEDVIAVTQTEAFDDEDWKTVLHYIKKGSDYRWTKEEITVSGELEIRQRFLDDIREKLEKMSVKPGYTLDIIKEFDCSTVDGIVLCGGDGTYNEGMNAILRKTQESAGIDFNNCDDPVKLCRCCDDDGNVKDKTVSYRFDNILNDECTINSEQWNPNNLQMVIYRQCYQYRLIKRHFDRIFRRPTYNLEKPELDVR
ncbi:hypothetical protein KUTeg_019020 [Tegillarca granosa]|uniref:DAGKc domain-containing protein n=1 Tax=Tegillarca granosa TaxID=220873 RepID=A0ABQ9EDG2_TEGGR|nr:hypothetical protein KUTeg_019020 [Tegillarca granosa]